MDDNTLTLSVVSEYSEQFPAGPVSSGLALFEGPNGSLLAFGEDGASTLMFEFRTESGVAEIVDRSAEFGVPWTSWNGRLLSGIAVGTSEDTTMLLAVAARDPARDGSLFTSNDDGATWNQSPVTGVDCLTVFGEVLFAIDGSIRTLCSENSGTDVLALDQGQALVLDSIAGAGPLKCVTGGGLVQHSWDDGSVSISSDLSSWVDVATVPNAIELHCGSDFFLTVDDRYEIRQWNLDGAESREFTDPPVVGGVQVSRDTIISSNFDSVVVSRDRGVTWSDPIPNPFGQPIYQAGVTSDGHLWAMDGNQLATTARVEGRGADENADPASASDNVLALFVSLVQQSCSTANSDLSIPDPATASVSVLDGDEYVVTDAEGTRLIVNVDSRIVYPVGGPTEAIASNYGFGCDPAVFQGTSGD